MYRSRCLAALEKGSPFLGKGSQSLQAVFCCKELGVVRSLKCQALGEGNLKPIINCRLGRCNCQWRLTQALLQDLKSCLQVYTSLSRGSSLPMQPLCWAVNQAKRSWVAHHVFAVPMKHILGRLLGAF